MVLHFVISGALQQCLNWINIVVSGIFVLEAVLKILGLGPISYFTAWGNILDFAIILLSITELLLKLSPTVDGSAFGVVKVLPPPPPPPHPLFCLLFLPLPLYPLYPPSLLLYLPRLLP